MKLTSKRHANNVDAPAADLDKTISDVSDLLPDGLYLGLKAWCRSCQSDYPYEGDVCDFDEDMSYCGRSYRCIP